MNFTILIVSHNRKSDLQNSLLKLEKQIDKKTTEIIVFLDGCSDNSSELQIVFPYIRWILSPVCVGASAARNKIYPLANSEILIGLDDDAHFLTADFFSKIKFIFETQPKTAIIAFEEVKGVFETDAMALAYAEINHKTHLCSEFVGCGFALRKSAYLKTRGFPSWIDIYGEESCLAIEIIANDFNILYDNSIKVNHRVDVLKRKNQGQNYFRFGKQLKNVTFYFLVYYKKPLLPILKLYLHNFKKYAILDLNYFIEFFKAIFLVIIKFPKVLHFRNPVNEAIIDKLKTLSEIKF